jgi:aryl-alcohol dehydrogenase-like predicted oxidoreductase
VQLALGTVQFGLAYGIAGRGAPVPADETRQILRAAADAGVELLDTAPAYGDIEERLGELAGDLPFRVVSKIPSLQGATGWRAASAKALAAAELSRRRLGRRLWALLFHHASDLEGDAGREIWEAVRAGAERDGVRLGVSCYSPDERLAVQSLGPHLVQLPGNALDQRSRRLTPPPELHLRSAFLQGLLLMPISSARRRLPAAAAALVRWEKWREARGLSPLDAALSVVKGFASASAVVLGVDRLDQFLQISAAWSRTGPLDAAELAETDLRVIDPRNWTDAA